MSKQPTPRSESEAEALTPRAEAGETIEVNGEATTTGGKKRKRGASAILDETCRPKEESLEPRIFEVFSAENFGGNPSVQVDIPPEYKVLTGGVRIYGSGAALTACYPVSLQSWRAEALKISATVSMKLSVVALHDPNDEYCVEIHSNNSLNSSSTTLYANSTSAVTAAAGGPLAACEIPLTSNGEVLVGGGAHADIPLTANTGSVNRQCWVAQAMDDTPVAVFAISIYPRKKSNLQQEKDEAEQEGGNGSKGRQAQQGKEEDANVKNMKNDKPPPISCMIDPIKGRWGLTLRGVPGGEMRFTFGASSESKVLALSYLRSIADPAPENGNLDKVPTLQWQGKRQPLSDGDLHDAAVRFCHSTKVSAPATAAATPTTPVRPRQLNPAASSQRKAANSILRAQGGTTTPRGDRPRATSFKS